MQSCTRRPFYVPSESVNTLGRLCFTPALLLCFIGLSGAQQIPRNLGIQDTDVPSPQATSFEFGHVDASGLNELRANVEATGFSSWLGMTASGTAKFPGSTDENQATLLMLPGNRVRLEIKGAEGKQFLTVVNGNSGHAQYGVASNQGLSELTLAFGVAPFDLPSRVLLRRTEYVVVDQGSVVIGGKALHRVTIESSLSATPVLPGNPTRATIDCYFDPTTHLLVKSASFVLLPSAGRHRLLRTTSYANYMTSANMSAPGLISETLDGMPTWSLSLTSLDVINVPKPEMF